MVRLAVKAQPLIDIRGLCKSYQLDGHSTQVLKQIQLQIMTGEMVAIVGASGSGKSTLMNIIGLLDRADAGQYLLQQQPVDQLSPDEAASLRNRQIGFVFQQFNLLPRLTAAQNVALPLVYRGLAAEQIQEQVKQALNKVGMANFSHHKPNQLSGGQQQRVAIARALVGEPQVLLADEPTGALDSKTGQEVMQLFHQLHAEGRTLIIITHDEQIAGQCQRQITLVDGEISRDTKSMSGQSVGHEGAPA